MFVLIIYTLYCFNDSKAFPFGEGAEFMRQMRFSIKNDFLSKTPLRATTSSVSFAATFPKGEGFGVIFC